MNGQRVLVSLGLFVVAPYSYEGIWFL